MKINIMLADPVAMALKATLGLMSNVEFVESPAEGHMLIAERSKDMAKFYSKEKYFCILSENKICDQEAENVFEFTPLEVIKILELTGRISQVIFSELKNDEIVVRHCRPGKKSVLVIDDTPRHQKSAVDLLSDYDLTIATGFDEALALLENNKYEVVLTDMEMPMSTKGALSSFVLGKLVPYGLLVANEAARLGAEFVAVVTDLNHHTDPFSAAFDVIGRHCYEINGAKVKYVHAPMTNLNGESVKDWLSVINNMLS